MAIWGKLKTELDRAGRAAQDALDEGRLRLELHRARQRADRGAQALGYAAYRAHKAGGDLAPEQFTRLSSEVAAAEAEAERIQRELDLASKGRSGATPTQSEPQPPV